MTEKIQYIPARQKNAAVGGHVAGAEDIIDDALGKEQNQINQETILALNDRYTKSQTYNKTELDSMITTPNQKYVNLSAEDGDTLADIFDGVTGAADTIYRVGSWDGEQYDATVYSEYAFDGTNFVYLNTKTQVGEVFDISLAHASGGELAKYADLEAALGTNGANVPEGIRKGGMSVKFVLSSDNKYVQYRLMADEWSTTVANWQGVGNINDMLQYGEKYIISNPVSGGITQFANFNTADGTFAFPSDSWLFIAKCNQKFALPTTAISYMIDITSVIYLVFNKETSTLSFKTGDYSFGENDLLLAVVRKKYSTTNKEIVEVCGCFNYTVNGKVFNKLDKNDVSLIVGGNYVICSQSTVPNFNTTDGTLTFPSDTNLFVSRTNLRYTLPTTPVSYTVDDTSLIVLIFNYKTGVLSFQPYSYTFGENDILMGAIRKGYGITNKVITEVNVCFNYTIDSNPFTKVQQNELLQFNGFGFTESNSPRMKPNIDTLRKILDLGENMVIYLGNKYYALNQLFPNNPEYYRAIPIYVNGEDSGSIKLIFNVSTKRIYPKLYDYSPTYTEFVIGGFRLGYSSHNFISANLPFDYTIDGHPEIAYTHSYQGEVLPINNCVINKVFELNDFGTPTYPINSQGMDIYNDLYLFQGSESINHDNRNIIILDLNQKSILGNFLFTETGDWHINNINCAGKENDTDKFPLLYISECFGLGRCAVIKISDDADSYNVKQLITFNTSAHYGGGTYVHDWFIDIENNLLYCYGKTSQSGTVEIVKFDMPNLTNSEVTLTDNDVLDSFVVEDIGVYQGSKIINNRLICPEGNDSSQWPSHIKVVDLIKKKVVTTLHWNYGEPEAVALYKKGLLVVDVSSNPMYRLITI